MFSTLAATAAAHAGPIAHGPWGPGWGGPGPLIFLIPLFWIVVIGLVFALVGRARWRRFGGRGGFGPWGAPGMHGFGGFNGMNGFGGFGGQQNPSHAAEATLAERFAQGDIDEIEYRARLEVLRANRPQGPQGPQGQ